MTRAELLNLPTVIDVETAGRALGIGRTNAYTLVRKGEFPCKVIRVGRAYRVPTASLLDVLQIPALEPEGAAAA
ncbi:helix-turn-helix domain-containing protein [Streptomyces sp. SRF1]|nr:helix-turn-helix domain-containing protein [Streptomyces sp. SRF1]MDN3057425.1 helix-turn-helix domain-containing protein [Streptomyces sp. SRF1]